MKRGRTKTVESKMQDYAAIMALKYSGLYPKQVAERFNKPLAWAYELCKQANIELRSRHKPKSVSEEDYKQTQAHHTTVKLKTTRYAMAMVVRYTDLPVSVIAERFGVAMWSVYRACKEFDVDTKKDRLQLTRSDVINVPKTKKRGRKKKNGPVEPVEPVLSTKEIRARQKKRVDSWIEASNK